MVPSVSVMCTASRMMLTFSARADFEASIEGAESAFQIAAGEAGAGVCPAAGITAKIDTKARRLILLSMVGPHRLAGKYHRDLLRGKWQIGYILWWCLGATTCAKRSENGPSAVV